jgi:hypothetical protein
MTLPFTTPPLTTSQWPRLISISCVLLLATGTALAADRYEQPEKPDAVITTSESIDDHEGAYEDIHDHEGATEDIHNHEGASEDIHGLVVESERLHGMGHAVESSDDRLAAARAKLKAARSRHAPHEEAARQAPAAVGPETPASSSAVAERYEHWTGRIDVSKHRIEVAKAAAAVWDEAYARMIQSDYPRGEARQKLIDSREGSKDRIASEEKGLARLIEEARRQGVPPGVLALHTETAESD